MSLCCEKAVIKDLHEYINRKTGDKIPFKGICCVDECIEKENLWRCTRCTFIGCGRYTNQHALNHYERTKHAVSIQINTYQLHCYDCDKDFDILPRNTIQGTIEAEQTEDPDVLWKQLESQGTGSTGLQNLGNTCYINSTMQILALIMPLRNAVFQEQEQLRNLEKLTSGVLRRRTRRSCSLKSQEICVTTKLGDLFRNLCLGEEGATKRSYCPLSFVSAVQNSIPNFATFRQQDAQEFLRLIIDRIHWEITANNGHGILKIFQGSLRSDVTCLACSNVTTKVEPYLDLSLDIPLLRVTLSRKDGSSFETRDIDLVDCLKSFTRTEKLGSTERYNCQKCSGAQNCTKKMSIESTPPFIFLHLKRFKYGNRTVSRSKLRNRVTFPLEGLRIAEDMYDLIGIVCHHGSSVGSGHYTSYGKCGSRWLHYNDSVVTNVCESVVAKSQAYLLLYKRRTT